MHIQWNVRVLIFIVCCSPYSALSRIHERQSTFITPYVFIEWWLIKHKDNFTSLSAHPYDVQDITEVSTLRDVINTKYLLHTECTHWSYIMQMFFTELALFRDKGNWIPNEWNVLTWNASIVQCERGQPWIFVQKFILENKLTTHISRLIQL
jgi:hypothetical protein